LSVLGSGSFRGSFLGSLLGDASGDANTNAEFFSDLVGVHPHPKSISALLAQVSHISLATSCRSRESEVR
jgi:hypothetical protein